MECRGVHGRGIRNPGRNVPLALALGTGAVIVIYLLLNVLYLYVLPVNELAAVKGSVLDVVADRLLGARAGNIMGVVSIVSLAGEHQRDDVRRAARVFRDGARRAFFRSAATSIRATRRRRCRSSRRRCGARLLVLTAQAQALLTYTGFAIILFSGARGGGALRAAREAAGRRAAVPHLGLSGGAGDLRAWRAALILIERPLHARRVPTGAGRRWSDSARAVAARSLSLLHGCGPSTAGAAGRPCR